MKTSTFLLMLVLSVQVTFSQELKPYILGTESNESISVLKEKVETALTQNGMEVLGQYQPAGDENRWVIVFSSPELKDAVKEVGGLTGFAAALRLGITFENGKNDITYTNPAYWGNAYFRDDFDEVSSNYAALTAKLESAMRTIGTYQGTSFGSEKGLSTKDLRKYRYMIGMPRFDDPVELADLGNYQAATAKIESSANNTPNVSLVYQISIPEEEITLYGFGLSGEDGEANFLPKIDITNPEHTAFLPYDVLVTGGEVLMLHGRYRIALSFPDLTMGTFTKIMSTPGNIEDLLKQLVD